MTEKEKKELRDMGFPVEDDALHSMSKDEENELRQLGLMGNSVPTGFQEGGVAKGVPALGSFASTGAGRVLNIIPATLEAAVGNLPGKARDLITGSTDTNYIRDLVKGFTGKSPENMGERAGLSTDPINKDATPYRGKLGFLINLINRSSPADIYDTSMKVTSNVVGPELVAKGVTKALPAIKEAAGLAHLRMRPSQGMALGSEGRKAVVDRIFSEKAVPWWGKAEDTASKLEEILNNKAMPDLDEFRNALSTTGKGVSEEDFIKALEVAAERGSTEQARNSARKVVSEIKNKYGTSTTPQISTLLGVLPRPSNNMPINKTSEAITEIGNNINFKVPEMNQANKALSGVYGAGRNVEKSALNAAELADYNAKLARVSELSDALTAAGRTAGLQGGGLTGKLADMEVALEAGKELAKKNWLGVPIVAARALSKGRTSGFAGNAANLLMSPRAQMAGTVLKRGAQITPSTWDLIKLYNEENNQ